MILNIYHHEMRPQETVGRFAFPPFHLISGSSMSATLTIAHKDVMRRLTNVSTKAMPYAAASALTETGWGAARGLKGHMDQVFDQPVAFTRNGFRVDGANKNKLEAVVLPKDKMGARHYLFTQEEGGVRPQTGIEKLLASNVAFDGILQTAVPADDAKLNRAGNLSSAQIQRLLSGLGAQRDKRQNTTSASRSRQKSRESYFVPAHGGLSPGVFARQSNGRLKMILAFTSSAARYRKRLGYEEFVREYWDENFPETYEKWFEIMIERFG